MKPSSYSLQLLLQFSLAFSETFQLLLPWPEEDHIILSYAWLLFFLQSYGSLSVLAILSTEVLVSTSPHTVLKGLLFLDVGRRVYSNEFVCPSIPRHNLVTTQFSGDIDETFQLLLSPDIIWRNYRNGFILHSVLQSLCLFVHRHNLVSTTPLTVFKGFWWNSSYCSQDWRWSYFIEVMLYWFLPNLFPFLIFFYMKSWPCNTACSFQWIWMKPFSYYSHDLKRLILYQGALDYFSYKIYGP